MTVIDLTIVNVSLPTIGRDLHFSQTNLQWVVTAYALTFGGFLAARRPGRRSARPPPHDDASGWACSPPRRWRAALATGAGFLIASAAVQGIGAAIMLPAALSIVMNMFPEGAERNKALGIWGGLGAGGATVGVDRRRPFDAVRRMAVHLLPQRPDRRGRAAAGPRIVPETRARHACGASLTPLGAVAGDRRARAARGRNRAGTAVRLGRHADDRRARAAAVALLAAFLVIERRGEATDPAAVDLPAAHARRSERRRPAARRRASTRSSSSAPCTCSRCSHYSALQTGFAWLAGVADLDALAGLSQALVTRGGAKIVMAFGMTVIGVGMLWATQVPVHGHFLGNLLGPFLVAAGAGTAFAFIPISIAALAGVKEQRGRARVRAAEHLPAARRRARDRDRLERRRQPLPKRCCTPATPSPRRSPADSTTRSGCSAPSACSRFRRSSRSSAAMWSRPPPPRRASRDAHPVARHQLTPYTPKRDTRTQPAIGETMRKIINAAFVSLDGVTQDPQSWAIFDSDAGDEAAQTLQALDGMLMGRSTYEYFADVMPEQTGPYADAINAIRKYVFSSTLENAQWNNSTIIRSDVVTAVTELKRQDGRDLIMYGYGRLNQTLLENHLVDEIRFSVHPVLVGQTLPLKLTGTTPSPSGVVALTYEPTSS